MMKARFTIFMEGRIVTTDWEETSQEQLSNLEEKVMFFKELERLSGYIRGNRAYFNPKHVQYVELEVKDETCQEKSNH